MNDIAGGEKNICSRSYEIRKVSFIIMNASADFIPMPMIVVLGFFCGSVIIFKIEL